MIRYDSIILLLHYDNDCDYHCHNVSSYTLELDIYTYYKPNAMSMCTLDYIIVTYSLFSIILYSLI